jgi:hypothetical protein
LQTPVETELANARPLEVIRIVRELVGDPRNVALIHEVPIAGAAGSAGDAAISCRNIKNMN